MLLDSFERGVVKFEADFVRKDDLLLYWGQKSSGSIGFLDKGVEEGMEVIGGSIGVAFVIVL